MLRNISGMKETAKAERISKQFAENIMLACTAVNDCIYCAWAHTKVALETGSTIQEIEQILALQFDKVLEDQVIALSFAQHFAESQGKPTKKALQKLGSYYGPQKSNDIINYLNMITMGNLLGNTIDAFESRLRGKPSKEGSLIFEFLVYLLGGALLKKIVLNN
jgi:AhpD family alkylhydroperoxidase